MKTTLENGVTYYRLLHDVGNMCTRLNGPYVLSDATWMPCFRSSGKRSRWPYRNSSITFFARCHDHGQLIFVHGLKEPVNSDGSPTRRKHSRAPIRGYSM
jgi:hypothetical protein